MSEPTVDLQALAQKAGIAPEYVVPYGREVAKIELGALGSKEQKARYVVVTATSPTPFGEGKTTTAIGLVQGMAKIDRNAVLTIRQPAQGPVFGIKGGATGNGASQVEPATLINLHLTGDFHAITAAHNLLSAIIDNHLYQGNELEIEERSITWPRVLDVNDRALRHIVTGLGGRIDGVTRQSSFDITPASEVMVIMSLATSLKDLRERLGRIVIGRSKSGKWITAEDLQAAGAMTALLRDALQPNLLRTSENTPVLIHTGPFGNIATGCSSVVADLIAAQHADYVVTEAGFGADMGAERFFDLKCAVSGLRPHAAVLVTTVRSLKSHSGKFKITTGKGLPEQMLAESPQDVRAGQANLLKHIEIVRDFGVQPVVAINAFPTDFDSEHEAIRRIAEEAGARVAIHRGVAEGGKGTVDLANVVAEACDDVSELKFTYDLEDSLETKLEKVATKVYGADGISIAPAAAKQLKRFADLGYGNLPVVIAKTHLSISSDASLKGAPTGWTLPVREVRLAAGAGYVYAICGTMRTMPGLSKSPAAERIGFDENGTMVGLS